MKECPTCHEEHSNRSTYCDPKCQDRAYQLRRKYGITPDVVFELYKKQSGKCAICKFDGDVRE